jgi:ABC-type transport system substrate-binding protein
MSTLVALVVALVVSACGGGEATPAPAPKPQIIKQTVVVEKEVEKIVTKERVVEKQVVATPTAGPTPTPRYVPRVVERTVVVQATATAVPKGGAIAQSFKNFRWVQNGVTPEGFRAPVRKGGTVNIAFTGTIVSRDPTVRRSFTVSMGSMMAHSRLVRGPFADELEVLDTNANVVMPDLAETWSVSDDGKAWTFNLRKGVKWQNLPPVNGREFTAEDAAFTANAQINGTANKAMWGAAESAEAVDKYTLKINMKAPYFSFVSAGPKDHQAWMLSPEVFKQDGGWNDTVIGTGAFIQTEFDPKGEIKFKRNPDFWRAGKPYVDAVNVFIVKDAALRESGLFTGKFDKIHSGPGTPQQFRLYQRRGPQLNMLELNPLWAVFSYAFRLDLEPYSDVRFRRALALGVNWQELIDTIQAGAAWMGPMVPWHRALKDGSPPSTPADASPWFRYDKDASIALLAELGFGPDNPVTVPFVTAGYGGGTHTNRILAIKDQLKHVGIILDVDIKPDFGAYYAVALSGKYPGMSLMFQTVGDEDDIWWNGQLKPGNKFKITDPEIMDMGVKQRGMKDNAARKVFAERLWEIERSQIYRIPAWEAIGWRVSSPRLRNYAPLRVNGEWPHQGGQMSEIIWLTE